jgi:membrane-bound ClpP family serine protease
MNTKSRLITGTLIILLGTFLLIGSLFWEVKIVSLIYGIVIFVLGIFIFFNKKEDKIEKIKIIKNRKGGSKK